MGQKRCTPEQIIGRLRQAELRSAESARVAEIVRELGHRPRSGIGQTTLQPLGTQKTALP